MAIKVNPAHRGQFTAKARRAGMGVQEFARHVLAAAKGRYSSKTRTQANLARRAGTHWKKGAK